MCLYANVPMNEKPERLKFHYYIESVFIKKSPMGFFL